LQAQFATILIELLLTINLQRYDQAKKLKTAECEKAVGLIGWLVATN